MSSTRDYSRQIKALGAATRRWDTLVDELVDTEGLTRLELRLMVDILPDGEDRPALTFIEIDGSTDGCEEEIDAALSHLHRLGWLAILDAPQPYRLTDQGTAYARELQEKTSDIEWQLFGHLPGDLATRLARLLELVAEAT